MDNAGRYTIEEIESVYRKLKNYIYYSTGNLYYREKIAEFECSDSNNISNRINLIVERKLINLTNFLNGKDLDVKKFKNKIKFHAIPKKAKPHQEEDNGTKKDESGNENTVSVIHNTQTEQTQVDGVTYLIDAPIEIHIISTLWVIQNGLNYEEEYIKSNYGNILSDRKDLSSDSLRLFQPYFYNYQKWRDNSIAVVRDETKSGHNVAMISLDIKDFYNSCKIKESDYLIHSKDNKIGKFLFKISQIYYNNISKYSFENDTSGLPIGLLSSAILSNYYLRGFDKEMLKSLSPVYYGRYVDDILIIKRVIENPSTASEINEIIEEIIKKIYEKDDSIVEGNGLVIQSKKIIKYYFDAKGPTTLLDKFEKEIKQNSSEFRFLPDTEDRCRTSSDFLDSAYAINYSGSKQKFRNIEALSPDKFGVSTFLAKKIYSALTQQEDIDSKIGRDIIAFFKFTRAIEFYSLWEKAFTYFVVINDESGLLELEENINNAIEKTTLKKEMSGFDLQKTLSEILKSSMGMALSLNPDLYKNYKGISVKFLMSNMTRHKYVALPLMLYIDYENKKHKKYADLTQADYFQHDIKSDSSIQDVLRKNIFKFCPRYIPFHEVVIIKMNFDLLLKGELKDTYLSDSFDLFYELNYYSKTSLYQSNLNNQHYDSLRSQYFNEEPLPIGENSSKVNYVNIPSKTNPSSVNIGIGNIELYSDDFYKSLINKPVTNAKRKNRLFTIINQATKDKNVDFLVLPEACVPCRWLDLLANKSRTEKIAMIFGLEHLVAKGHAYNLIINLLPVTIDHESESPYVAVIPIIRLKNHYSPSEIEDLEGHHHKIPQNPTPFYHLVSWKNIFFSTFNCFELTDIAARSIFRSQIDILFACEYNSDINYFSNLVESSARDLHCFVVQANSSYYGDSRITQPTKTATKDILKIKGGKNPTVLIGQIDIHKLRKFQYLGWNLQLKDRRFKPTPPGFNRRLIAERLGIKIENI